MQTWILDPKSGRYEPHEVVSENSTKQTTLDFSEDD
jgi:hypothetical protein